jgi:hypothetical protein
MMIGRVCSLAVHDLRPAVRLAGPARPAGAEITALTGRLAAENRCRGMHADPG